MRKFTLRFSMYSAIVGVSLSLFTTVSFVSYYQFKKEIISLSDKITDNISLNIATKIRYFLTKPNNFMESILDKDIIKDKDKFLKVVLNYLVKDKYISSIYIANSDSYFLQVRKIPKLAIREIIDGVEYTTYVTKDFKVINYKKEKTRYNPTVRPWYINSKSYTSITMPYIFSSTKKLGITIDYKKIIDNKKYVIAVDYQIDSLKKFINNIAKETNSHIIIKDLVNDKIFFSTFDKKDISSDKKYITTSTQFKVNKFQEFEIKTILDEDYVLRGVYSTLKEILIVAIVVLFIFIILSIQIGKSLSLPILSLANSLDRLSKLDTEFDFSSQSKTVEIYQAEESLVKLKQGMELFKKYLPINLVKIIMQRKSLINFKGEKKDLVIMFSDIENFTYITESCSVETISSQLFEYFDIIEKVITKYEGTLDKYIGDSVMAFWGAPLDVKDKADKALSCVIEMQKMINELNKNWKQDGKEPFKTRVGIHCGDVLVGNIGSRQRVNYTIIGDNVNIASRLESINKNYNTYVIISEQFYKMIKNKENFNINYLDEVVLKGKEKYTKIYKVDV